MQMRVIDDTGKVWEGGGRDFREAFYLTRIEGDMSPHLIDKMGFIGLSFRPGATLVVRFNPSTVAEPALAGLYYWLRQHPCERLCLAHGPTSENVTHKIAGRAPAGLHQMHALIEEVRGPQLPFTSLPEELELLGSVAAFRALFAHWRASGGLFEDADYRPLLSRFARDRFSIFSPNSSDGALEIMHAGSGLQIPDKQSHAALEGSRLEEVAGAFGQWASVAYRDVLERQQPRFDHIYALVRWPRAGEVERKYSRMILPCRTRDGRRLLLGVNCDRDLGSPDLDGKAA